MKRYHLRIIAALAAASFASFVFAHDSSGTTTPAAAAVSTSSASAFAGTGGGLSASIASNHQTAGTSGAVTGAAGSSLFTRYANVGVSGAAMTSGLSNAANVSTGDATGAAQAGGVSTASVIGTGEAHTVHGGPLSTVSGNAEAITGTGAASGVNGLAVSGSEAVGSFNAQADASHFKLGPLQHVDVGSSAVANVLTMPAVSITLGSGTVSIQNEAAANAFGQARVGSVVSQ